MGNFHTRLLLRLLIAAGGCVAGGYSAFAAFATGNMITNGAAGAMFGLAFAAVVMVSWIMLPWADLRAKEGFRRDAWLWRGSWLVAVGFVLANSIVYSAHYRVEAKENAALEIDAYERAQRASLLAEAELGSLRTNPRWEATSGCSNATAPKSRAYCEHLQDVQTRLQAAGLALAKGRPAAKDAGAAILAWVLGGDETKVSRGLPVFWAVVLELMASLCMKNAFGCSSDPNPARMTIATAREDAPVLFFGTVPQLGQQRMAELRKTCLNDNIPAAGHAA